MVKDFLKAIHLNYARKEREDNDPGFGLKIYGDRTRYVAKDGSTNITRMGLPLRDRLDIFHSLIKMSWGKFLALTIMGYFAVNLFFAGLYFAAGMENMTGVDALSPLTRFWDAFFFSCQTITTVGYGRIAPVGFLQSSIAAVESLLGLLLFALITGLLYGRFAKAEGRLSFSENILISPYRGITGLMFRLANPRSNELIELEAMVIFSIMDLKENRRTFQILELERKNLMFLSLSWTVVHPIDENSPLAGLTEADFMQRDVEWMVVIKAFDESRAQMVYTRASYKCDELVWGAKFTPMDIKTNPKNGRIHFDLSNLNAFQMAELPEYVTATGEVAPEEKPLPGGVG